MKFGSVTVRPAEAKIEAAPLRESVESKTGELVTFLTKSVQSTNSRKYMEQGMDDLMKDIPSQSPDRIKNYSPVKMQVLDSGEKAASPKLLTIHSPDDTNPRRKLSPEKRAQALSKSPTNFFSNDSSN